MAGTVHLSTLLGRRIVDRRGDPVGKLADLVVRLQGDAYPIVIGLVAKVARRDLFLPMPAVDELTDDPLQVRQAVDLRRFERRDGEVLLRADVLRHRLIDISEARLVRAADVELAPGEGGWSVRALDVGTSRPLFGLVQLSRPRHVVEDWKAFEPLVGHAASARLRGRFGRLTRLRPAQIADLLEEASKDEGSEILGAVHADPELEADVFEEIDEDLQARLFGDQTDAQVAEVLARMQADDAADAVAELPQNRRQAILDLLPVGQRTKVLMLLGYNPASAGGLMSLDFLSLSGAATVGEAMELVREARAMQPAVLSGLYTVDDAGRLQGAVLLTRLLQAAPGTQLAAVAEPDPVHVHPTADVVDLALLMSDYNLVTVPVASEGEHRVLGVVTVDDVLEATIPEDWRRRESHDHAESHGAGPAADDIPHDKPNSPVP